MYSSTLSKIIEAMGGELQIVANMPNARGVQIHQFTKIRRGKIEDGSNGESPFLGDYAKNDLEESGTVTRLRMASCVDGFVSIRWYDGGVDSPLTPAKELILISRQA